MSFWISEDGGSRGWNGRWRKMVSLWVAAVAVSMGAGVGVALVVYWWI